MADEVGVPTVVVVGGGLAGLTAAYRLLHPSARLDQGAPAGPSAAPARVVVLESRDRLGGKIITERFDGFVVEGAADSFLARKPWARALIQELGAEDELIGSEPGRPRAFVRRSGSLVPFPDGLTGLVPTSMGPLWSSGILSPMGCARVALEPWVPRRRSEADETVASFVRRRFGTELYERLMQPLLGGLYGNSPEELSIRATFPVLVEAEQRTGSVMRGLRAQNRGRTTSAANAGATMAGTSAAARNTVPFLSLVGGMGRLIDLLGDAIGDAQVRLGVEVDSIHPDEKRWSVNIVGDRPITADAVIVTAPAPMAARLLEEQPKLRDALARISFSSTSVVTAAYKKSDFPSPLSGHGYLNPTSEGRRIAGVTWSSRKFSGRAPDDHVLLRGFVRPPHLPPDGPRAAERLQAILAEELRDTVGLEASPQWWRVYNWESSMPGYTLGHMERVRRIQNEVATLPGLWLAGCSYGGVGIPDTIQSGEQAALQVLNHLS